MCRPTIGELKICINYDPAMPLCYGLKYAPLHSYVEALTPDVMVFGDEAFERKLGLDGAMQVRPAYGVSVLVTELAVHLSQPCEDAVRSWLSRRQKESSL